MFHDSGGFNLEFDNTPSGINGPISPEQPSSDSNTNQTLPIMGTAVTIHVFSFTFFLTKTLFPCHQRSFVTFSLIFSFSPLMFLSFTTNKEQQKKISFGKLSSYNSGDLVLRYGGGTSLRRIIKSTTCPASCCSSS